MDDLISRQALKNALTDWQMQYAEKGKDTERFETLGQVLDLVEQMPTIEPIQCGECVHHNTEISLCYYHNMYTTEGWFCADGEKLEKENDWRWMT